MNPVLHLSSWRRAAISLAVWVISFWVIADPPTGHPTPTPPYSERDVKAVFLFNFTQFIEWPGATNTPLVIGVLGDDPFGPVLDRTVAGEQAQGRPLAIKRGRRLEDVRPCHLLFISRSEAARLPALLRDLRGSGVVTVGDTEVFRRAGGMITFFTEGNRVRFAINRATADGEGLKVSAKLLKVARVTPAPETP